MPLDITIETLIAVVLVSAGLVSGAEKLKPVTHSAWAGQIEREGGAKNPYKNLEIRSGFWDVRVCFLPRFFALLPVGQVLIDLLRLQKSRQEFADWMRTQGQEK